MVYVTTTPEIHQQPAARAWLETLRTHAGKHMNDTESVPELDLPLHVVLTSDPGDAPFRVYSPCLIVLSLYQLDGHACYTGLHIQDLLRLYLHLALIQRRALAENNLLIPEDFIHPPGQRCLMSRPSTSEDFALHLESLEICPACLDFYKCVSCENELISLSNYRNLLKTRLNTPGHGPISRPI